MRCREIQERDLDDVAGLLGRGFPLRSGQYWVRALARLKARSSPEGYARYGYLLQVGDAVAGVLLTIHSRVPGGGVEDVRCNLSSWYVEPEFRSYASLLVARATKRRQVTYVNTSPAPHTRPIIAAQGFEPYSRGLFVAVPALAGRSQSVKAVILPARSPSLPSVEREEARVLREHEDYGCYSFWCATGEDVQPFVFAPRKRLGKVLPCVHLIYCRDIQEFIRLARPIGLHFARHGIFFAVLDANEAANRLPGRFFDRGPKYFKGPRRPRLGDLAYTEAALFGDLSA